MPIAKRKFSAITKRSTTRPPSKRKQPAKRQATSSWRQAEWIQMREIAKNVSVVARRDNHKLLAIKKIVKTEGGDFLEDGRPIEVRVLDFLPECNRIVKPLLVSIWNPHYTQATVIYPYHASGDLTKWKKANFDDKNNKTVPESYIWRCFLQIGQAVSFIHNELGAAPERERIIHRDIKPCNILVVDNGTTYPSFKLHDFDCALLYTASKVFRPACVGTFSWQPPENPLINTTAADVWSLGACIHFLATGKAPIDDVAQFTAAHVEGHGEDPQSAQDYSTPSRYYQARVPRRVLLIDRGKFQYSEELNSWMSMCLGHDSYDRPTAGALVAGMWDVATSILQTIGGKSALTDLEIKFGAGE